MKLPICKGAYVIRKQHLQTLQTKNMSLNELAEESIAKNEYRRAVFGPKSKDCDTFFPSLLALLKGPHPFCLNPNEAPVLFLKQLKTDTKLTAISTQILILQNIFLTNE